MPIKQNDQQSDQQLQQLKSILLNDDNKRVVDVVRAQAKELVTEVLTEALKDRQKKDASITTVLTPIVENSVERSITNNRDKFIGYLYPIMGSLVRKSVAAFLNEFMEKTNKLIENSFTYKGLKWRFQAKQANVSFAQYVISQTYVFRVEQVFLIHTETGLLLNSVALDPETGNDADLMSSMLTAITDFIADSFGKDKQQGEGLDVIKTANFTLVIKNGPSAVIAAAVTGNMPENVPNQLQKSLEQIHQLYFDELQKFKGDAAPLANTEQQLRDCLITQSKKQETNKNNKKPWYALIIIGIVFSIICYQLFAFFKQDETFETLQLLNNEAGIIVINIKKEQDEHYYLEVWRDPAAISIRHWLQKNKIKVENIALTEQLFISADTSIIQHKAQKIYEKFLLSGQWKNKELTLNGKITYADKRILQQELSVIAGGLLVDSSKLELKDNSPLNIKTNILLAQHIFKEKVGEISTIQLHFRKADISLDKISEQIVKEQTTRLNELFLLAKTLNIEIGVLVLGTSDNSGVKAKNNQISQQRASIVKAALINNGIDASKLHALGVGEIPLNNISADARKVLFSIIYL